MGVTIDLDEEEKQAIREYEEAVKSAAEKRDKILSAVAILRGTSTNQAPVIRATIAPKKERATGARPPVRSEGTVEEIIKGTTKTFGENEYTATEAYGKIGEVYPNVNINLKSFQDKLSKLAAIPDSGIKVSVPRMGRIPAKYKNV